MDSRKLLVRVFFGVLAFDAVLILAVGTLFLRERITAQTMLIALVAGAVVTGVALIVSLWRVAARASVRSETKAGSEGSPKIEPRPARMIAFPLTVTVLLIFALTTHHDLNFVSAAGLVVIWLFLVVPFVVLIVMQRRRTLNK